MKMIEYKPSLNRKFREEVIKKLQEGSYEVIESQVDQSHDLGQVRITEKIVLQLDKFPVRITIEKEDYKWLGIDLKA